MTTRAFGLLCAAWFSANIVFRWCSFAFFSGHSAYGWARVGVLENSAMVLAVVGSALLAFVVGPAIVERVALACGAPAERVRRLLALACIAAIAWAEVDMAWYALGKEHLRWADVEIFIESDAAAHFGLTGVQMARQVLAVVVHVLLLGVAAWWLPRRRAAGLPDRHRPVLGAALLATAAAGFATSGALALNQSEAWAAIAAANPYEVGASRFVRYRHADAAALTTMLEASLRREPPPEPALPARPASPARHLLVIAIEGWNTRHFDAQTMPFLAGLSHRFMRFPNHIASGNNTLLGITGLAFGQTPALFFEQRAHDVANTGLRRFREAGYAVARFGHGLDSYRQIDSYLDGWDDAAGTRSTTAQALAAIRDHVATHERTLSMYYYGDSHYPYVHAPEFTRFRPESALVDTLAAGGTPEAVQAIVNRYRNALAEADERMRALFSMLDWESMAIVITGDHGESMMETGRLSHSSSLEQPQIGTPLMLYHPGIEPAAAGGVTSHLDVMPTLLELAGLAPVPRLHGRSLRDARPGHRALAVHNRQNKRPTRVAVVASDHKIILDWTDLRAVQVVDLMTADDRPLRLQQVPAASVQRSLQHVAEVLAAAGCVPGRPAAAPLRHCRSG